MHHDEQNTAVWWQTALHILLWAPLYFMLVIVIGMIGSFLDAIQGLSNEPTLMIFVKTALAAVSAYYALVGLGHLLKRSNKVVASSIIGAVYAVIIGLGLIVTFQDLGFSWDVLTSSVSAVAVVGATIYYNLENRSL